MRKAFVQIGHLGIFTHQAIHRYRLHGDFVGLEDFALGGVKLDAVAIERDVATCDHDAGAPGLQCAQGQGGRGQTTCPVRQKAFLLQTGKHGGRDVGATGTQVPTNNAVVGGSLELPRLAQVLNEHAHISGHHWRCQV